MDTLERQAGREPGSTKGGQLPGIDYIWDFLVGTTNDLNLSRMVNFYEQHPDLAEDLSANPWRDAATIGFEDYYSGQRLVEENYAHPTMTAYKCAHLD